MNPRMLPKWKINGKVYYLDQRLREFRNVDNPHDRIDFARYRDMTLVRKNTEPTTKGCGP